MRLMPPTGAEALPNLRLRQAQGSNANFVLAALREAGDLVTAALGEERRRELRGKGAAMSMDEAISFALDHIDPKLLTGPIASIDR